jgi:hypothetical protein
MESLKFTLAAYGITIIFAMLIACFIPALAFVIKKMNLGGEEAAPALAVPSSDAMQEEETIAVAIAVAHSQRQ